MKQRKITERIAGLTRMERSVDLTADWLRRYEEIAFFSGNTDIESIMYQRKVALYEKSAAIAEQIDNLPDQLKKLQI